jgi:hypothetical protein
VAGGQRFTVSFRGERVIAARDIREALRQAQALDGHELIAITRES